jgi:hypothetical protein
MKSHFFHTAAQARPVLRRIGRHAGTVLAGLAMLWSCTLWAAEQCTAHSGAQRQALVELYTSEGCSSCPPADQWLGEIGKTGGTDRQAHFIPLALHVDYWDSLGWHDRFAQHRFTERQQNLSERAGSHIVYTPEVAVGGFELRDWNSAAAFKSSVAKINAQPSGADIQLSLAPDSAGAATADLDAHFTLPAGKGAQAAQAYVAVFENNLTSQVQAGENTGATLHHQFVVRLWLGPVPITDGRARITQKIALAPDANVHPAGPTGVVAFVQNSQGDILQALALPECH